MKGRWKALLFSLPFAAVGLGFFLLSIFPNLAEWQQMKSWPQVDAHLHQVELIHNGDTYSVKAHYSYRYEGQAYTSNRVAIMGGSDNMSDFHEQLAARLEAARSTGRPVSAWVNPQDPSDAVLNRDMRWDALGFQFLIAFIFGGVGFGLMAWTLLAKPSVINHPEGASKPWLTRREWTDNQIVCDAKGGLWGTWIFAIFWNLISWPLLLVIPSEISKGNSLVLIALIFPLVGIWMFIWALKATSSWRRFGQLTLVMDPFPGALGGQVGGYLELPLPYENQQLFPVTLACIRSYITGSGKNRSRKESLVWQAQGLAYSQPSTLGTRLNVCFDVPEGLPATEGHSNDYRLWRLSISADLPGVDLHRQFEIPVYPTGEKSRVFGQLSTDHPQAVEHRETIIESVLDIQQVPGGVELFFPMLRRPSTSLWGLLFGSMFTGAGWIMHQASDAPTILTWLFLLIGLVVLFVSIKALFGSLRVRLDHEGLVSQRYWLGMPIGRDQIPRNEITRLMIETSYQQQDPKGHMEVCRIRALTHSGKKIPVAINLRGREVAQQALEAIASLSSYPTE